MKKRKVCLLVKRKENEKCEHRKGKGIGHPSDDDESERRELLRKTRSSSFTNTFGNSSLGDSRDKISLCR